MTAALSQSPLPGLGLELSVVIATHNRGVLLRRTLEGLAHQTLHPDRFEVVVVDDGSTPPAEEAVAGLELPFAWRLIRQKQAGPAAARDAGIAHASAPVLLLIDDDMEVPGALLQAHLDAHRNGAEVVLGRIEPPPRSGKLPLFERFHLHHIVEYGRAMASGAIQARGVHLCTGNVSLRRSYYYRVGGFDPRLERSEDRDLGLRLERAGARFAFAPEAITVHNTDHTDLEIWLSRAYRYGLWDSVIGRKHPELEIANPWRFFYRVSPLSRPLLLAAGAWPELGRNLWRPVMTLAERCDESGQQRMAMAATTLVYGLAYFVGMRDAAGTRRQWLAEWKRYRRLRRQSSAARRFVRAVRADHESLRRYRRRYHQQELPASTLPVHIVTKVGFQMLVMVRLMHLARDLELPGVPQLISRAIRHLYGAEIHWGAVIEPGISVVHGNGLVISHRAVVGAGCILSQNVTLGEAIDPQTRRVGGPQLIRDVHVGPGAQVLGPITVGEESKLMAGSVLATSVPPRTLVRPPSAIIEPRAPGAAA